MSKRRSPSQHVPLPECCTRCSVSPLTWNTPLVRTMLSSNAVLLMMKTCHRLPLESTRVISTPAIPTSPSLSLPTSSLTLPLTEPRGTVFELGDKLALGPALGAETTDDLDGTVGLTKERPLAIQSRELGPHKPVIFHPQNCSRGSSS